MQVQNGCDHRCTFCVIPFGRGNSRSLPPADVVAQVRRLVDNGYREVVLTGVDITSYRADGAPTLGALVKRVLREVPELERLRLSSIDSVEADADLLDALANEPRLMPHLHLSLQAGDDMILKRMKRRHSRADAIAFCDQVRRLRPDVVFGGDIIAGFPTETEDDVRPLARSGRRVRADASARLSVLAAARHAGRAHAAGRGRCRSRSARRGCATRARRRWSGICTSEIGARRRVLTEQGGIGRTEQFTPVRLAAPVARGLMLDVTIAGHDGRQLLAAYVTPSMTALDPSKPDSFAIFVHFSISLLQGRRECVRRAGRQLGAEPGVEFLRLGHAAAIRCIAALSFAAIAGGVPAGANTPCQNVDSACTPDSISVGTSG